MPEPVTPEEIIRTQFSTGQRKHSYDQLAVDDFLDSVVSALRNGTFDPNVAHNALFPTPRGIGARGYSCTEVDDLLDRLAATPPGPRSHVAESTPAEQPGAQFVPTEAHRATPAELTESDAVGLPDPYEKSGPGLLRRLFRN